MLEIWDVGIRLRFLDQHLGLRGLPSVSMVCPKQELLRFDGGYFHQVAPMRKALARQSPDHPERWPAALANLTRHLSRLAVRLSLSLPLSCSTLNPTSHGTIAGCGMVLEVTMDALGSFNQPPAFAGCRSEHTNVPGTRGGRGGINSQNGVLGL